MVFLFFRALKIPRWNYSGPPYINNHTQLNAEEYSEFLGQVPAIARAGII